MKIVLNCLKRNTGQTNIMDKIIIYLPCSEDFKKNLIEGTVGKGLKLQREKKKRTSVDTPLPALKNVACCHDNFEFKINRKIANILNCDNRDRLYPIE